MANDSKRTLIPGDGPLAKVTGTVAFLLVIALFAAGVLIRGALGAALLGVLLAGVLALLAATWKLLPPAGRVLRLVVVLVLVAVIISVLPG
ncbi:hypothetical protein ACFFQW_04575 [Umezawaea endophytica]|uniref:Uncharacterized protein n=1 Tax=Umezawaea endophytica TaxID=1654476 RepID=A0A9X3ADQ3_9PSEU|nr:hypothetical protein [Umezawaea endophytica]MCS7476357.1 hypothetical protein [Umezawaea endophytica]